MRVLIVDDSSFLRQFLREQMKRLGFICAEAGHGEEAIAALRSGEVFDLMLVDMNMPVMNGLECLEQVSSGRLAPAMKVMMVTTETDDSFIERALELGADEFLMKPFTAQSLKEKLALLGMSVAA